MVAEVKKLCADSIMLLRFSSYLLAETMFFSIIDLGRVWPIQEEGAVAVVKKNDKKINHFKYVGNLYDYEDMLKKIQDNDAPIHT